MQPLAITAMSIVSSLGRGLDVTLSALRDGRSGLAPCRFETVDLPIHVGQVDGVEDAPLPPALAGFECRNNRLARLALAQDGFEAAMEGAKARYGASRIGVFLGTSTSGILHVEQAYRLRGADGGLTTPFNYAGTQSIFSVADFVLHALGLSGPSLVISSACSSTTKVFATAARMIQAGLCDAAIVGGADSLCLTTLYGFNALQLLGPDPCRPFDVDRQGLSIGEGAGFALLERPENAPNHDLRLISVGESSDAHHMSAPRPDGAGAMMAMSKALEAGGLRPEDIDYINLHGTATRIGDSAEDKAVVSLFGLETACNSTKGHTGHALGASGILEAIIAALSLRHGLIPGSPHTNARDPDLQAHYIISPQPARLRYVLSNSFGFGGTNASLILGQAA
jgi:3-oxoacyl-[acyl-carrier-protein] synthase I